MQPEAIIERSSYQVAAELVATLPRVGIALVFLAVIWLGVIVLNRVLRTVLTRVRMRRALAELVIEITDVGVWVVAAFMAAAIAFPSITPASIVAGLGLGTVAIGFAFRDIFENFLAGILILYREPFRLGDCILCNGVEGFVQEITARDTHVRQTDGQRVVLPNAMLFKNQVWVLTDQEIRRTTIMLRIMLSEDVDQARALIHRTVSGLDSVHKDSGIQIFAQSFQDNSVEFEVTWWTGSRPVDIRRSRDEVIAAVKRALDEAGIRIGIPQRSLLLETPVKLADADRQSAELAPRARTG